MMDVRFGSEADTFSVAAKSLLRGLPPVWWTPKLKREEREEVSDEQSQAEAEASIQALQFRVQTRGPSSGERD